MAYKDFPTVWINNSPDSLLDIAVQYCTKNPEVFCSYDHTSKGYVLRDGLFLPREICERMLLASKDKPIINFHKFINIFSDTYRTRLERIDVKNSVANDDDLEILTKHPFVSLNISNCSYLTYRSMNSIMSGGKSVMSLEFGSNSHMFSQEDLQKCPPSNVHLDNLRMGLFLIGNPPDVGMVIDLPNLRNFAIHNLAEVEMNRIVMNIALNAKYLTHLDLTKCELPKNLCMLFSLKHLSSLILCDVVDVKHCIDTICTITSLRHLDLSNTSEAPLMFSNSNQKLRNIVEGLPNLEYLDISGTNLAGNRTIERSKGETSVIIEDILTDIPGLSSRVNRPLEFLGLLNTVHEACYRHHIPAKRIAGDASEEQILTAGQVYCSRERMIQKVLNDLFQIFRVSNCVNVQLALDVVMEAMSRHLDVKNIQVSGSASLFYIVKSSCKRLFNIKMRGKIIKVLIDAMFSHYSDVTMLRNGCLTLIHFRIPEDVFFDYERLASLLLLIVAQEDQDDFVQRIGVYLLNSLACQVDGLEKKLVGDRGGITIMLQVIEKRLNRYLCDEVMETAWSTMWNVTDETPVNCARFLEGKGMVLFLGCLQTFPQKPELLRNMMGLLGNVAEVKELRVYLMKDEYLSVFSDLLNNKSDGIEVSYNAAGILAHIASDGPDVWDTHHIQVVKREYVLQEMLSAINQWNIITKRNINYRSFKPILRLLTVDHTPEARYWAVWALANLTSVYPGKYCTLLQEEGGMELLEALASDNSSLQDTISQLAIITMKNCFTYEKNKGFEELTSDDNESFDAT